MIQLTSCARSQSSSAMFLNPLHVVSICPMIDEPQLDTPESRKHFDELRTAYPGARSEIGLPGGRAMFARETPEEIMELIQTWAADPKARGVLKVEVPEEPPPWQT